MHQFFLQSKKGFTLIEVLVSVAVFSIVMLIATSAVFTIVNANKKSHSIKSVMTNLNFALESMMREIRMGGSYECLDGGGGVITCPVDGTSTFGFTTQDGSYIVYSVRAHPDVAGNGIRQDKTKDGQTSEEYITSDEVMIDNGGIKFYVIDGDQPRVLITVSGSAGKDDEMSRFNIQTTVTKRTI